MVQRHASDTTALRHLPSPDHEPSSASVDPRSSYVDRFWVPVVGPVAVEAARLFMREVATVGPTEQVDLAHADVAAHLGLVGRTSTIEVMDAIGRLAGAGIVELAESALLVRSRFPRLTGDEIELLPPSVREAHRAWWRDQPEMADASPTAPGQVSARILSLTATVEEILTNTMLTPQQLAHRWQRVVRIAEEARDENVLDAAAPDLETTLAECQLVAQELSEVVWAAQHVIAVHGRLPEAHRLSLTTAAASLIDWMVAEFPRSPKDSWVLDLRDL